ncbi:hypothetical protein [Lelliottia amnigena]|nr:hypothetical protein [Lelliottia amnigena]
MSQSDERFVQLRQGATDAVRFISEFGAGTVQAGSADTSSDSHAG